MNRQDGENQGSPQDHDGLIELLMKALEGEAGQLLIQHLEAQLWEADNAAKTLQEILATGNETGII